MIEPHEESGRSGGPQPVDHRVAPTRVGLVVPDVRGTVSAHDITARKSEFEGLALAIGLDIVFSEILKVREVRPATFIGAGQVEEIKRRVEEPDEIDLILFDTALAPVQQRNLETETKSKVLDRTALILEIFGERAATREGVLQVELAHLNYQKSRLVRSWTHLERQRGGFGFLGGPGETQIESDRRLLEDRIKLLEEQLEKVKRTRGQQKAGRDTQFPVVALVGYTNAGKSSLFNRLTGAGVFAKDLLFATLDTTIRKVELPHGRNIMLSDTVGFVADLPTTLVAAFRATLEEVTEADLILHVRDVANPDNAPQARDVLKVLGELGVSAEKTPILEVWNKIDLVGTDPVSRREALLHISPAGQVEASIEVSAQTGEGVETLLTAIETALGKKSRTYRVHVPHVNGGDVNWLYGHAEIVGWDEPDNEGQTYEVRIDPRHKAAFTDRFAGRIEAA